MRGLANDAKIMIKGISHDLSQDHLPADLGRIIWGEPVNNQSSDLLPATDILLLLSYIRIP